MELIARLHNFSSFRDRSDEDNFIKTLQEMVKNPKPEYLDAMVSYLDDESEFSDIHKIIIGMVECFPQSVYTDGVIKNLTTLKTKAPDWLDYIHYRITNSESYTESYRQSYLSATNAADVKQYLEEFCMKNPEKMQTIQNIVGVDLS